MNIIESDAARIKQYLDAPREAEQIRPASNWADEVVDLICNPDEHNQGVPIHYINHHDNLRFRDGEVTIWSGYNGHGKSLLLNQFILSACYTAKCLIISPEMPVAKNMQRMTHQATRVRHALEQEIRDFHKWTDDRLWMYDQLGTVQPKMVFAVIRYAAAELGINQIVVDSLMKCGISFDDSNGQKRFIDELTTIAKDLSIHIHLVAHSRKGVNEKGIPDKHDVKGVGDITDMVDNVLTVWRNKSKEESMAKARRDNDTIKIRELRDKVDGLLICSKQRFGDWEGNIGLWFDLPSQLFLNGKDLQPVKTNFA